MYTSTNRKPTVESTTTTSTRSTPGNKRTNVVARVSKQTLRADPELQQNLKQVETTCKQAEARAEKSETRSKKIEDRLQLAKAEVGKWLDAKDNLIQ